MQAFLEPLKRLGAFPDIQKSLERGNGMTQVQGCLDSQKAHFIWGAGEQFPLKVILTYSELRAKELYDDYRFFDREVCLFPARDLIFYNADIHSNLITRQRIQVMKALLERVGDSKVQVVMSDMAPNMSGTPAVDIPRAMYLVELALEMCRDVLAPGGSFVVKVFQGEGFDEYLREIRSLFTKVKVRKPDSSRARSREVYIVATGRKP